MAEDCKSCHQPIPEPKSEWLTSEEVRVQFSFNPEDYISGDNKIASKLMQLRCGSCMGVLRVWLKSDVMYQAERLTKAS